MDDRIDASALLMIIEAMLAEAELQRPGNLAAVMAHLPLNIGDQPAAAGRPARPGRADVEAAYDALDALRQRNFRPR